MLIFDSTVKNIQPQELLLPSFITNFISIIGVIIGAIVYLIKYIQTEYAESLKKIDEEQRLSYLFNDINIQLFIIYSPLL